MSSSEARPDIFDFPEAISDTFLLLDRQWRFVYLNRSALQIAGEPAEALLGRSLWDLYPSLLGTPIETTYRQAMAEQVAVHLEHPGVVTGTWYEIHAYPVRGGLAIYGRDITDRKRVENALRQSEERFRTQFENLPLPTYTWRQAGSDFTLVGFNKAAEAVTEGAIGRLLGMSATTFFRDEPAILKSMQDCCQDQEPVRQEMHYRFQTTGRTRDLSVTLVFVPPDLIMVHTEDITERKQAQRELLDLNQSLERRVSERTEELARSERALRASENHYRELARRYELLAREMEHRIGNHLAGVLGLVSAMRERGGAEAKVAATLEGRLRAMAHVHQMLTGGRWRPVALRTLVTSTMQAMMDLAPVAAMAQVDGPEVRLDASRAYGLTLILVEWFTNSCKHGAHSAPGGRLRVSWTLHEADGTQRVRLAWTERGGPAVPQPVQPSLGMQLVEGFAARELRGHCWMSFPPEGADHVLEFPAVSGAVPRDLGEADADPGQRGLGQQG